MQDKTLTALALLGALLGSAAAGYKVADWRWENKWLARDVSDIKATQELTDKYRQQENKLKGEIDELQKNTIHALQGAASAAADAAAVAAGLHDEASALAGSLTACNSESAQRSAASAKLLADLFSRADETAGRLARVADDAQIRGRACEQAYDNARGAK